METSVSAGGRPWFKKCKISTLSNALSQQSTRFIQPHHCANIRRGGGCTVYTEYEQNSSPLQELRLECFFLTVSLILALRCATLFRDCRWFRDYTSFLSGPHRRKSVAVKSGDDAIGKSGEHHGSIQVLTAPFKWKWSSTLIKTYWGNVGLDCDFSRNQRDNHSCLALSLFLNFFSTNWSLFQGSGEECVRLWCVELQSLQKSCQSIFVRYLNERPDEPWQWSVPFWQHSRFQRSFPPWSTLRASSLFYRGSATTSFTAEFTLCLRYGSRFKAHITTIVALAIASHAIRLCFKMIQNNDQEVCANKEQGTVCLGYCKKKKITPQPLLSSQTQTQNLPLKSALVPEISTASSRWQLAVGEGACNSATPHVPAGPHTWAPKSHFPEILPAMRSVPYRQSLRFYPCVFILPFLSLRFISCVFFLAFFPCVFFLAFFLYLGLIKSFWPNALTILSFCDVDAAWKGVTDGHNGLKKTSPKRKADVSEKGPKAR